MLLQASRLTSQRSARAAAGASLSVYAGIIMQSMQ